MSNRPVHKKTDVNCKEGIWKHMRKLKRFTFHDIYMESNMHRRTIQEFIQGLLNAGYLKIVKVEKKDHLIKRCNRPTSNF